MSESFVWVVDADCDLIKKRQTANVERDQKMYPSFHRNNHVFASELEAAQFMADRAVKRLAVAEEDVKREKKRWRNCMQKLSDLTVIE